MKSRLSKQKLDKKLDFDVKITSIATQVAYFKGRPCRLAFTALHLSCFAAKILQDFIFSGEKIDKILSTKFKKLNLIIVFLL